MNKEPVIADSSPAGSRVESTALAVALKDYSKWFGPVVATCVRCQVGAGAA
jgi:hypothetical protein